MAKQIIESHKAQTSDQKIRLSDYCTDGFKTISSKSAFKKAIKKDLVLLNDRIGLSADYVNDGDIIDVYRDDSFYQNPTIELKLEILYEDDYLAIIYKPAGIVVSGNRHWTIQNALSKNLQLSSQKDALKRPEPIHRLDYPTSGALLIGKTSETVIILNQMFEEKVIKKTYHAVAIGDLDEQGSMRTAVDGKSARTEFRVLEKISSPKYGFLNLVELKPQTGRKHQLRRHLSEIGHPIFGDLDYGIEGQILKGKGLFLHATSLSFTHPKTNEPIEVRTELPKKFKKLFPDDNSIFHD